MPEPAAWNSADDFVQIEYHWREVPNQPKEYLGTWTLTIWNPAEPERRTRFAMPDQSADVQACIAANPWGLGPKALGLLRDTFGPEP